jgi:hypothetical protein
MVEKLPDYLAKSKLLRPIPTPDAGGMILDPEAKAVRRRVPASLRAVLPAEREEEDHHRRRPLA